MDIAKKNRKKIPQPTNFGANLRFLRRREGLTQSKFAEKIGITRNRIASYENGGVEPNAKNFLKISRYFKQPPRSMMEDEISLLLSDEFISKEVKANYVKNSLNEFFTETTEMESIVAGYQEFYAMRRETEESPTNKAFLLILDDLLALLNSLIVENWKFINNLSRPEEEE